MTSSIASLHKILKDETRRKIILLLQEKNSLSYVDLMKALGITNTGKMNYHLKVLGDLLSKKEDGQYFLSEKGALASRLLIEFPEAATMQKKLVSSESQVLWVGIIICSFALIGLFILFRYLCGAFVSGYVSWVEDSTPFFFMSAIFLFIGSYMIVSDLKRGPRINLHKSSFKKRALIASTLFIIVLGITIVGVAGSLPMSVEHLTQVQHEENPGASYTVYLNGGSVYRYDIVVTNMTRLDKHANLTVTHVENNYTYTIVGGTIREQTIEEYDVIDSTGHYEIDLHTWNVTQITVCRRTGITPNISRLDWWAVGVFTLIAGVLSFFGFELIEVFSGRKTGIFWLGLMILGFALSVIFEVLWYGIFHGLTILAVLLRLEFPINVAEIIISLILLFVGFRMMKKGVRKEGEAHVTTTDQRIAKLEYYLSQRNYRALVYLSASILVYAVLLIRSALGLGSFFSEYLMFYINWVGVLLLFLFYGRPHMYSGWYDPASVLPYALLVFGLFVEIFIVCEFFISVKKLVQRMRRSESVQLSPREEP